jgi:hypothetical protein
MQDGLFFRVLRRFNTLVLSLAILVAMAFGGYSIWKHGLKWGPFGEPEGGDVPLVSEPLPAYGLTAESFDARGFQYPLAPSLLVSSNAKASNPYVPWQSQAANLMVIDDKGEGHWLFKDNNRLIETRDAVHKGEAVPLPPGAMDTRPVIGLVMTVIDGDANKDGKFDEKDPLAIYAWKQGAGEAVKLLDVDSVVSMEQTGADRYRIVYLKGKESRAAIYALPDFALVADKALPAAPK